LRSLRGARIVPVVPVEPVVLSVLLMPEPVVLPVLALPEEVDGVVIVLASVERPVLAVPFVLDEGDIVLLVLGEVDIVPVLFGDVPERVAPVVLGFAVPLGAGVVAVGLAVDGLWLAVSDVLVPVLPAVCAWARPMVRAAMAAAVREVESLRMVDVLLWNG
jgi:hypothetical protein